jgi:hypothetical protein
VYGEHAEVMPFAGFFDVCGSTQVGAAGGWTQLPILQTKPVVQSVSAAHVVLQRPSAPH